MEALIWVLSAMREDRSYNQVAYILGSRAQIVNFLLHPDWGRSMHLQGLRLVNGGGLDMSLMIKRLTDKGFKKAKLYRQLTRAERCALGALFLEVIAAATKMVEIYITVRRGRKVKMVRYTDEYWAFLGQYKEALKLCRTVNLPMLVPPKDWKGHSSGGWLTAMTTVSPVPWERWPAMTKVMHSSVLGSLNILQRQAFRLDERSVDLCRTLWKLGHGIGSLPSSTRLDKPDDAEYKAAGYGPSEVWEDHYRWVIDRKKDGARSTWVNSMISLQRLESARDLHFVHKLDAAGRVYVNAAGLNPQGAEHYRSMFQFAELSPVKEYIPEFAWSLGDAVGLEKDPKYRVNWLSDNRDMIERCGNTPLEMLPQIDGVKKPHVFMQLCRDWAGFRDDPGYKSGTIHWRDQTCSGWGHVACLTGCQTLAQYSNTVGSSPADLYLAMAKLVMVRVKWRAEDDSDRQRHLYRWWTEMEIPRSVWKDALMPIIYGRSYQSLADGIVNYLRDVEQNFLTKEGYRVMELARVLATQINDVVKEALPHVRDLSRWLSITAKVQMDSGLRPYFFSPNGLAVETYATESRGDRLDLNLAGRTVRLHVREKGTEINRRKTCSKLVPAFIHGHDAAFLQRFVTHWENYKHPIATVHDSFGTTLQHIDTMQAELNDQWARFYSVDYLNRHWCMVQEVCKRDVPPPPMQDTLDRNDLGNNPYLFC